MRFLCISDIHGHADLLAAVLAEGARRGYQRLLVAGDLLFPGPTPLDTWKLLMQANATCVQGVSDRAMALIDPDKLKAQSDAEQARLDRLRETRKALGEVILARLAKMSQTARIPLQNGAELVLVHGCPRDPTEAMTHDMSDEELLAQMGDDPADIVVCGASHVAFDRTVSEVRIVNVGSVGEAPGLRVAHATIVEVQSGGFGVEQFAVPALVA